MDRRWWGAAVVAVVLLVALIAPGIAGTRQAGSASRPPIANAPSVGDCLRADPAVGAGPFDSPRMRVLSGPLGPCDSANFGEVVSVQDVESFRGSSTDRMAVLDPAACERPAAQYLGWAQAVAGGSGAGGAGAADELLWQPAALQNLILFGPDASQYAVGQRWISCVLRPPGGPYAGSVRGGRPGPAVDAFGTCRSTANESAGNPVSCSEPHVSEVFGVGSVEPAQVPALLAACRQRITDDTGLADPSAGGALSIWVETGGPGDGPPSAGAPAGTPGRCTVAAAGGRQLEASLLGVGDGPLPLVP